MKQLGNQACIRMDHCVLATFSRLIRNLTYRRFSLSLFSTFNLNTSFLITTSVHTFPFQRKNFILGPIFIFLNSNIASWYVVSLYEIFVYTQDAEDETVVNLRTIVRCDLRCCQVVAAFRIS